MHQWLCEQWLSMAPGSTQVGSSYIIVDTKQGGYLMKPNMDTIDEKCNVVGFSDFVTS